MIRSGFCTIGFQKTKWARQTVVEQPLIDILPLLAQAGFDGVEIWQPHIAELDAGQLAAVARLLHELPLAAPMLSPYLDFTSSDESARQSLAKARQTLTQARVLGARAVRVFTGKVGSAGASPQQWQRAADCLGQLADESAREGIAWALELHGRNLTDTPEGARKLLEAIARANVGLIAHSPAQLWALDAFPSQVLHLHARNALGEQQAPLRDGATNYGDIITRLRAAGFDGYLCEEWMAADAAKAAGTDGPYLRGLLHG